jgi:hypothetical protein
MTPLRMMIHVAAMCKSPDETAATIKTMLEDYAQHVQADKDYDIEWYANECIKVIDQLTAASPAWTPENVKAQLGGRITNLIPYNL